MRQERGGHADDALDVGVDFDAEFFVRWDRCRKIEDAQNARVVDDNVQIRMLFQHLHGRRFDAGGASRVDCNRVHRV